MFVASIRAATTSSSALCMSRTSRSLSKRVFEAGFSPSNAANHARKPVGSLRTCRSAPLSGSVSYLISTRCQCAKKTVHSPLTRDTPNAPKETGRIHPHLQP